METVKLIQNNKVIKNAIIVFLGTILLTISAKVKIPFYPVPMTMQTFVVIFLGMCFGYKLGLATVALYLIEGIVGIIVKKKYDDTKCNKELDSAALDISELFKNTKPGNKQLYKVSYNPRKIFQEPNPSGKSIMTSISFDFKDEGVIILSCYDMDIATNQIDSPIKDINQFDTFRIDIRSKVLTNYLEKV